MKFKLSNRAINITMKILKYKYLDRVISRLGSLNWAARLPDQNQVHRLTDYTIRFELSNEHDFYTQSHFSFLGISRHPSNFKSNIFKSS